MKSIRNVDVLYTIHEKSRVLEECICRVESACDTGHFESVDSALRTKPELRAALGTYIRQMLALLGPDPARLCSRLVFGGTGHTAAVIKKQGRENR